MAIFPYNKIGQEIILYDNINKQPQPKDYFTIASGYDCKDPQNASGANISSVGIRWTISRNDSQQNKQPPIGYPNRGITPCWFVLPDNVALCILTCIKNHSSNAKGCVINIPEIDKAIKEITARIAQQNSAQGAKNSSLQKKHTKFKQRRHKMLTNYKSQCESKIKKWIEDTTKKPLDNFTLQDYQEFVVDYKVEVINTLSTTANKSVEAGGGKNGELYYQEADFKKAIQEHLAKELSGENLGLLADELQKSAYGKFSETSTIRVANSVLYEHTCQTCKGEGRGLV